MQEVGSQKTKLMQMFLFGIMAICLEKDILAWQVNSLVYDVSKNSWQQIHYKNETHLIHHTQTSGTYFQIH